ncbi:MAG TPA: NAD(P)-dependent oxidoreductase [Mucilaginibacter sp.]|jgi:3-hydroxyisobutyrate dehydrogenase-like beta-hydroxyacid dehydrogenase|nr:NAD(P)-dependent oxidoreductase [Mucilaginibacter sp.]
MEKKIGFIGLGNMGIEMARNLITAGYHLQVYNRTAGKADELDQASITKCKTPAGAAHNVPVVITMLSDDDIVKEATVGNNGILSTLQKGGIHISMSTLSPGFSTYLAEQHKAAGSVYLTSPVFGRPEAAVTKKLWICVSGDQKAKEAVKPILECLGQGIIDFGDDTGSANVVKIIGNAMIFASVEMMAEAFRLAEEYGLDRSVVANFFGSTLFNAPVYQNYGKLIAERKYEPVKFKAVLGRKDLRLAHELAKAKGTPMPIIDVAYNRLKSAVDKGWGERDCVEAFDRGVTEDKS